MDIKKQKSLTETGLKYFYQFFILHFILISVLIILSEALSLTQQSILSLSASKIYFVVAILFLFVLIFIWLARGLARILNGRMEFGDPHESNVIIGTILMISFVIIYFINLSIAQGFTGGIAFVAAVSSGFDSTIIAEFISVLVLSITSNILLGLSLIYFIRNLIPKEKKAGLKIAFVLLVLGTFTFNLTTLIAYILFFKIYKDIHLNILNGKLKPAVITPCPNCSRDIAIESKICKYCGAKFEKIVSEDVDPRFNFNLSESKYNQ